MNDVTTIVCLDCESETQVELFESELEIGFCPCCGASIEED